MANFININVCRSFNQVVTTNLTQLTAQDCTEVIVFNSGSVPVLFFDNNYTDNNNSFVIGPSATFTFRGINDCAALSAKGVGGSALLYYRTQYYAMHVLNRT